MGKKRYQNGTLGDTSIRRFFTGLSLRLRADISKVTAQERIQLHTNIKLMPTIIVNADGADGTKGWKKIRSNFVAKSNIWNTPRRFDYADRRGIKTEP
jgi:hypothetical protein